MTADSGRALAIIERAHRGALETQFSDALYCAFLFHRHLGGLDVLLRGPAVTYAAQAGRAPELRLGGHAFTTVTDPRKGLDVLVGSGVGVWAEEPDLSAYGLTSEESLLPGVRRVAAGSMAARWSDYRTVFFL
ncbi:hypothetical protein [Streptomyces sp. H39-S7]|uniref:hypothetical protein n=1 Tax=Streptomyces sp. H39-S7 TaxID=3004357 RepID=UPI0022AE5A1B|nr:hypothetical protein [Streptomyces sp. H39-S7]MCZ4123110.1 hypothetical protein [Streptomyces sp. H39-S7]